MRPAQLRRHGVQCSTATMRQRRQRFSSFFQLKYLATNQVANWRVTNGLLLLRARRPRIERRRTSKAKLHQGAGSGLSYCRMAGSLAHSNQTVSATVWLRSLTMGNSGEPPADTASQTSAISATWSSWMAIARFRSHVLRVEASTATPKPLQPRHEHARRPRRIQEGGRSP